MSIDFSIKPVGSPAVISVFQPPAAQGAVATQLPASQTVTAVDASTSARNDLQAANDYMISHQAFFDQAAASIVYQVVNSTNNEVVDQYPDDATLRRRAYFHAIDLAKDQPARPLATDLKA
jgi:hypothetical protein